MERARAHAHLIGTAALLGSASLAAASFIGAGVAHAQARPAARAEARIDAFHGDSVDAVHLGGGYVLPLGTYARLAALAGAGLGRIEREGDDRRGVSARLDLLVRFHGDPVRQSRWGPYVAGGLSARADPGSCCDGFLSFVAGLEGPYDAGRSWAFELGFGGGVHLAVVLRSGGARWR